MTAPVRQRFVAVRSSQVVVNASSLFGATLITSALGFAFWAVAARLASAGAVGDASAAVSLMQLLGSLGTFGLGTLLIGELAGRARGRGPLLVSGVLAATVSGGALGAGIGLVLSHLPGHHGALLSSWPSVLLFAVGTATTSATTVLDQALVGLGRGPWQLGRNTAFALTKLALLPVLAALVGLGALGLYAAWTAGHLLSCALLLRRGGLGRPLQARGLIGLGPLRGLGRAALAHHLMNVAAHAPLLLLPSLVAWRLGPVVNAAFYMAVLLASFAWMASSHLSTALFAVPPNDLPRLRRELRTSVLLAAVVAVAAAVGVLLLAGPVLGLFGADYRRATPALVLLVLATAPSSLKSLFVAVLRVQGRLGRAASWTTAGSLLEICLGAVGLVTHGTTGVALGVLVALLLEASVMTAPVVRALRTTPTKEDDGADRRAA